MEFFPIEKWLQSMRKKAMIGVAGKGVFKVRATVANKHVVVIATRCGRGVHEGVNGGCLQVFH